MPPDARYYACIRHSSSVVYVEPCADLQTGLDMSGQAVAFIHGSLEKKRSEVRPRDLLFAADLVVKTALAMARTGARDYPEQMKNGELADELADMLTRYLVA